MSEKSHVLLLGKEYVEMNLQKQPTLIQLSSSVGARIVQLRRAFGWSQDELYNQTKVIDNDGIGVSIRRIGAIERLEANRFRYKTLNLIASAFKLELTDLLNGEIVNLNRNNSSTSDLSNPSYKMTRLFKKELQLLNYWISRQTRTIAITGRSGIGKSSLLTTLSDPQEGHNLLWFDGNDLSNIDQIYANLSKTANTPYLILDEDYQRPVRDLAFFSKFLESSLYNSEYRPNLILSLRDSTYQTLAKSRLLVGISILSLHLTSECLNQKDAWPIEPPLSNDEKLWIINQFQDQPFNTLLIDTIYLPYLISVRKDLKTSSPLPVDGYTLLPNIYQNFILQQPEWEQKFYQALSHASQLANNFPTLFLMRAIFSTNTADNQVESIDDFLTHIQRLELVEINRTLFFNRPPDWLSPTIFRFRFRHDLFGQSIEYHEKFNTKVDPELVAQLCQLFEEEIIDLPTLAESIATLLTLSHQPVEVLSDVSQSIAKRINELLETHTTDLIETGYLVFSMIWFGCDDLQLNKQKNLPLYYALQRISSPIIQRIKDEHLEELFERNLENRHVFPLFGWAHTLYKIGCISEALRPDINWILSECQILILSNLGKQITGKAYKSLNCQMKIDFSILMIWAEKWLLSGNILSEIISDWNPSTKRGSSLGFDLFTPLGCYSKGQKTDEMEVFLQNTIHKLNQISVLRPLNEYFELKKNGMKDDEITQLIIKKISKTEQTSIIVLGDSITASHLCQAVRDLGRPSHLLLGKSILEIETIASFPVKFLIAGNVHFGNDLIEQYMTKQQKKSFDDQYTYIPYSAKIYFQIGSCKAFWIKGGWDQKTEELVIDFIENKDFIDFCTYV